MTSRRPIIGCLALMLLAVPTSGLADGVSVTVTTGTTVYQPVAFDLGSGRPGDVLVSGAVSVAWLSNDAGMSVAAVASDLHCASAGCATGTDPRVIRAASIVLREASVGAPLDGLRSIARIVGDTGDAREVATFELSVLLPQVRPGRYAGMLRFLVVDPAALAPDDCGAEGEASLAWVVVPDAPCAVQVAYLPPDALRVAATAAGSTSITTPVTVTVQ